MAQVTRPSVKSHPAPWCAIPGRNSRFRPWGIRITVVAFFVHRDDS